MGEPPERIVRHNGDITYELNGVIHRLDGPAYITPDGYEAWYRHGLLHRSDGPAILTPGKSDQWYSDGKRHREDGPAIDGRSRREWWFRGKRLDVKTHSEFEALLPILRIQEVHDQ